LSISTFIAYIAVAIRDDGDSLPFATAITPIRKLRLISHHAADRVLRSLRVACLLLCAFAQRRFSEFVVPLLVSVYLFA
jgi:hypothetical protein